MDIATENFKRVWNSILHSQPVEKKNDNSINPITHKVCAITI